MTVCFTAPTAYKAMLAAGKTVPTLRKAVSAGEHLPKAVWEAFREATGVEIIDGIGATEMLHIFISAAGDDIRPGSTGRAVPGYAATIVDDDGAELPPGEPGRLAVKGPTGLPLPRRRRARRRTSQNGWNLTGDTFTRDDDGYFWYQARSDDMIISSGYNIAAPEVEEALLKHPLVAECAVVGVPDEARGMLVKAYVVSAGRGRRRARAAGLREGRDRAVQVPAGDRVRRPSCRRPRPASCSASGSRADRRAVETTPRMPEHSPRHLILSLFGLYARDEANWLSVRSLIALMEDLDVDAAATRSSVSRLKKRGVLEPAKADGAGGLPAVGVRARGAARGRRAHLVAAAGRRSATGG